MNRVDIGVHFQVTLPCGDRIGDLIKETRNTCPAPREPPRQGFVRPEPGAALSEPRKDMATKTILQGLDHRLLTPRNRAKKCMVFKHHVDGVRVSLPELTTSAAGRSGV